MERSNCGVNFTMEDLVQLESVEDMYFKTREIREEDDEDDYSDSNSSSDDEGDDADQDEAVEIMEIYKTERSKVQAFYSETCKCKMGVGEMACSATLSLDDITDCRNNCSELSSAELDLVILGIIHSSLNCSETSISGRVEKTRQSTGMCFSYNGKRICKKTLSSILPISQPRKTLQEEWIDLADPWQREKASQQCVVYQNSGTSG